jgi:hypothetical protein
VGKLRFFLKKKKKKKKKKKRRRRSKKVTLGWASFNKIIIIIREKKFQSEETRSI